MTETLNQDPNQDLHFDPQQKGPHLRSLEETPTLSVFQGIV